MNKIQEFISKYFNIIVLVILTVLLLRTCGSEVKPLNKRVDKLSEKIDSLSSVTVTKKDLQIEGLKV